MYSKGRCSRNSKTSMENFLKNTWEVAQSWRLCTEADSEPCQTSKMEILENIDLQIRNLSYPTFRKHFIDEFRPIANSVFNIHNPVGIKLLTRLKLGLTHLNEHRFNHKFQNCTSPTCICIVLRRVNSSFLLAPSFLHSYKSNLIW